ncbi:filamin-A-interacting protein 1-like isoform X2 [Brienomyrus brachyistius]|uniref:filamin-A-interacting protein 1-like isoform X2 n=1 Tax=Brienomyrus brachyistius TaxID=42636 RepID=UPI0020B365D8|nr:filamin-A-interacting protein 1-like isoform X2 [Brienomyrus brachyistius]
MGQPHHEPMMCLESVRMRSRKNAVESPTSGQAIAPQLTGVTREDVDENVQGSKKRRVKPRQEKEEENLSARTAKGPQKSPESGVQKPGLKELPKEALLKLLGVMEGEVQARDDVIHMLKSERLRPEALEEQYGSATPSRVLQALQRDGLFTKSLSDDVYQLPMVKLDHLEEKHRETYRRMLEQLLIAEKCHRRTIHELDKEKRKHVDYMNKSDDFTSLLEQDRERLKRLLEQEKACQARKDKDHKQRLEKVREELAKLKSFALMLVDERQLHVEQIGQQAQKFQDLNKKLREKEQRVETISRKSEEDGQRILKLQLELEHKATKFVQDHEEMIAKLAVQETQNRQLQQKLASLSRHLEELEQSNKILQKSEEELQELRDKISRGECGNSSLMAELENLRKRVLEMEGKDEEIMKTESRCRELQRRLQDEENSSRDLKQEVEKLQKRMAEMEKLEVVFNRNRSECERLHVTLEKEKSLTKEMTRDLETMKNRVKELESSESRLEKAENSLKDDLQKLKSFTVILVDERKNMAERIKHMEKKNEDLNKNFKAEEAKVTEVTEKLIEESKKLLKLKSEMEAKVTDLTKENEELKCKLACEEEKCHNLSSEAIRMRKRLDSLEEADRESARGRIKIELGRLGSEDNKVKELTMEIERLKNRLQQLEVVEGDLMKTEDEYDLLERKFRTEQDKTNVLSQLLEEMKAQIARNKAIEKGEAVSQEAELRQRCKIEEAKTRDLQADVQALKEKIHELMNKEDQLTQLQVEYSVLQQRFIEEENKKKNMNQEVINLTKELEVTKRYSRALRPSVNGRRMVDVPLASTGVQTDAGTSESAEEDTAAVFIRKSVLEENHIMSNLRQKGLKKPVLERYPPAASEMNISKSWTPWMRKKDTVSRGRQEKTNHSNEEPEMTVSQMPGRPLHIKVTPDHENSRATLEITGPRAEDFFSSTTIIPTLGLQAPRITIVPTPTKVSPRNNGPEIAGGQDAERTKSPVTITAISRAKSPERDQPTSSPLSPVSIITVSTSPISDSTSSTETREPFTGRKVLKMAPDKQGAATPTRKYSSNGNIITTEDNKIHIHLAAPFKRLTEAGPSITVRPVTMATVNKEVTGTVRRSPSHSVPVTGKSSPSKIMSSIIINPIASAPSRPTQSVAGRAVTSICIHTHPSFERKYCAPCESSTKMTLSPVAAHLLSDQRPWIQTPDSRPSGEARESAL